MTVVLIVKRGYKAGDDKVLTFYSAVCSQMYFPPRDRSGVGGHDIFYDTFAAVSFFRSGCRGCKVERRSQI